MIRGKPLNAPPDNHHDDGGKRMIAQLVEVRAASRLHFGLLSFGQSSCRAYGGVGVMIDAPALQLRVLPAKKFEAAGDEAARVTQFAARLAANWFSGRLPSCRIEVISTPPAHAGFGSGTQLALSVAAALSAFTQRRIASAAELVLAAGRGERSSIGAWGFELGGLLVEGGHLPTDEASSSRQMRSSVSPLVERVALPAGWRWLLLTPTNQAGLSGAPEREAFAQLPAVPLQVTEQLCDILWKEMLPAARRGDYERFSDGLYRYGVAAGNCFAAVQGGPFANPHVADTVARLRSLGVVGVGQSSWGPTVFALLPDEPTARFLQAEMRRRSAADMLVTIASACNRGAKVVIDGIAAN